MKKQRSIIKRAGNRKGSLEETISYAMYRDDPSSYQVSYRDKDQIKNTGLKDFLIAEEFSPIPLSRIVLISKNELAVWKKGQKEVLVK